MSQHALTFEFTRIDKGQKFRAQQLAEIMRSENPASESWLFVTPHEDLIALSAGLWLQAALQANFQINVLIVTDGSMGYCTLEQRDGITAIRKAETIESFGILGLKESALHFLGLPDAALYGHQGRRKAGPGEANLFGYTGLQNAMTWYLRLLRPNRVFINTPADLHPDNKITHSELMISLFHAAGPIWPELGAPIAVIPRVYEMASYCDFSEPPNLQIHSSAEAFEKKLRSIAAYRSQVQFELLVQNFRRAGAYEHLREAEFQFYSPDAYKPLFAWS